MAYPPLHRKLFKSDGAGPELKEEIVPHELEQEVTVPALNITDGARLYYNQSANRLQTDHWMAAVGFTATSDARHKRDLTPVRYDLSSISAYHYTLKDDGKPHVGLVAQEVQSVIPDAVSADKDGTLSLDYNAVVAALVEEVKDLKRRCDSLESEKVSLRAAVENLAEQKESLKKICALLTEEQDILRNENDVAMNEIVELKKRVAAQEKANAMLASTVSALQNAIGALESKA